MTELPTPIFKLSQFYSFLIFVIVPTGKLLVELGVGVISNCGRKYRVCCKTVLKTPTKNISQQKTAWALRINNASLSKSYSASPHDPHFLSGHLQSHLSKTRNSLKCIYIYSLFKSALNNIKLLVKFYFTHYAKV